MEFNRFHNKILKSSKRIKQSHLIWMCLNFVEQHPETMMKIGIKWIDHSHFIFNCKIFSFFVNRKPNSINSNFKKHGFKCYHLNGNLRKRYSNVISFKELINSNLWVIRNLDGFTQSTTEDESKNIKYIKPKYKIKNEQNEIDEGRTSLDILSKSNLQFDNLDNFPSDYHLEELDCQYSE